jgi:hypothetical protein
MSLDDSLNSTETSIGESAATQRPQLTGLKETVKLFDGDNRSFLGGALSFRSQDRALSSKRLRLTSKEFL